jgi:hypothetical protein
MNYRSDTTCLGFSNLFRKWHTKLRAAELILMNFNSSQSIFCYSFFEKFSLRRIFQQGKAADSQKVAKLFAFLIAGYPLHTDTSSSHFCKASMRLSLSFEMMDLFAA